MRLIYSGFWRHKRTRIPPPLRHVPCSPRCPEPGCPRWPRHAPQFLLPGLVFGKTRAIARGDPGERRARLPRGGCRLLFPLPWFVFSGFLSPFHVFFPLCKGKFRALNSRSAIYHPYENIFHIFHKKFKMSEPRRIWPRPFRPLGAGCGDPKNKIKKKQLKNIDG